jgi:replicative DNA helicase
MKQIKPKEDVFYAKVPPHSKEVETCVIGILLIEQSCVHDSINKLSADFFYQTPHNTIFKAIQYLYDNSSAIDLVTVNNYLTKNDLMDLVGGAYELVKMTNNVVSSAHLPDWIKILQSYYLQRQGITIGQQLVMDSYTGQDADAILNKASSNILNAQENVFRNTEKNMVHYLFELAKQRDKSTADGQIGINTGYNSLNALISGWVAPDLIILAARPAQGKTAFMLNTIINVLKQKIPVGIFSLEVENS